MNYIYISQFGPLYLTLNFPMDKTSAVLCELYNSKHGGGGRTGIILEGG